MIEEGKALAPDALRSPNFGAYTIWRERGEAFVEAVFGRVERQRFDQAYDPPPMTTDRNLADRVKRLEDLRDRPHTWELQVDAEGLRGAMEDRRASLPEDRIVTAGRVPAVDRVQLLREAYQVGNKLRQQLVWGDGAPATPEEAAEAQQRAKDKARKWAQETWEMLGEHWPPHERDFFGPGSQALGRHGFWLSALEEMSGPGGRADSYLERKLEFLADLLRQVDR